MNIARGNAPGQIASQNDALKGHIKTAERVLVCPFRARTHNRHAPGALPLAILIRPVGASKAINRIRYEQAVLT